VLLQPCIAVGMDQAEANQDFMESTSLAGQHLRGVRTHSHERAPSPARRSMVPASTAETLFRLRSAPAWHCMISALVRPGTAMTARASRLVHASDPVTDPEGDALLAHWAGLRMASGSEFREPPAATGTSS